MSRLSLSQLRLQLTTTNRHVDVFRQYSRSRHGWKPLLTRIQGGHPWTTCLSGLPADAFQLYLDGWNRGQTLKDHTHDYTSYVIVLSGRLQCYTRRGIGGCMVDMKRQSELYTIPPYNYWKIKAIEPSTTLRLILTDTSVDV